MVVRTYDHHETYCNVLFMDETDFDWNDLRLFLAVARHGGLSAAAQATGKSAPTLGRRMLALEAVLGAELFRRLPRGYELTEEGAVFLNRVVDLEAKIKPLGTAAAKNRKVLVKVSAGSWMTQALCEKAGQILKGNPETRLRFVSAEHVLDIARREAVIGIRNQRPAQLGLAGRKVGRVQFAVYAKNKKVKPWARVVGTTPSARWLAAATERAESLEVTAPRNALDLALTGTARALLPTFIGDRQRGLKRVTAPVGELAHDQWLVTHQDDRFVPEVRLTIDRIYDVIKSLHKG